MTTTNVLKRIAVLLPLLLAGSTLGSATTDVGPAAVQDSAPSLMAGALSTAILERALSAKVEGCHVRYIPGSSYASGDTVSAPVVETSTEACNPDAPGCGPDGRRSVSTSVTHNFECRGGPGGQFCSQAGFNPSGVHWGIAWKKLWPCTDNVAAVDPTAAVASAAPPSWEGVGCPAPYQPGAAYEPSDVVSVPIEDEDFSLVYECAENFNLFCGQEGFHPSSDHGALAWKELGSCSGTISPTQSPVFEVLVDMGGCPAGWEEGANKYEEDDYVSADGLVFQCQSWPYSTLCGQVGFKPLNDPATPDAWKQAWTLVGRCDETAAPFSAAASSSALDSLPLLLGGCAGGFSPSVSYGAGDVATLDVPGPSSRKIVYQCKEWPFNGFCSQAGFEPGSQDGATAWTVIGACEGTIPPTASPVQYTGFCTFSKCTTVDDIETCTEREVKPFSPSAGYSSGDIVRVGTMRFACLPYPFGLWCNSAAYAPGLQAGIWKDAWRSDGQCGGQERPRMTQRIKVQLIVPCGQITINEIEVYDSDESLINLSQATITVSGQSVDTSNAVDGDAGTGVVSGAGANPWLMVDLGSDVTVSRIELKAPSLDNAAVLFVDDQDRVTFEYDLDSAQVVSETLDDGTTFDSYVLPASQLEHRTFRPTQSPTVSPTARPTDVPSVGPSKNPTQGPSSSPTTATGSPTSKPTSLCDEDVLAYFRRGTNTGQQWPDDTGRYTAVASGSGSVSASGSSTNFNGGFYETGFQVSELRKNGGYSVAAWIRFTGQASQTYSAIVGGRDNNGGTEFFIGKTSGSECIGVQDGNYIAGASLKCGGVFDNQWRQLIYTQSNTGLGKVYVDDVEIDSSHTWTGGAHVNQEWVLIGGEVEGAGYVWTGQIDEVVFYTKELTRTE
ncbi:hypothetical protein THAOC_01236, partial [Thalassiosira oceanica]